MDTTRKMVKLNINTFDGVIVKNDENYLVKDNTKLKNLVVSNTLLHPFRKTKGHSHEGQEEVYYFTHGSGKMIIDEQEFDVSAGDIILIEDNEYHRVLNDTADYLQFFCVFNGNRKNSS